MFQRCWNHQPDCIQYSIQYTCFIAMLVDPVEGCGVISMDITTFDPYLGMDQDGGHPILKNLKIYINWPHSSCPGQAGQKNCPPGSSWALYFETAEATFWEALCGHHRRFTCDQLPGRSEPRARLVCGSGSSESSINQLDLCQSISLSMNLPVFL